MIDADQHQGVVGHDGQVGRLQAHMGDDRLCDGPAAHRAGHAVARLVLLD
ncbi:hypothetical protein [Streptomyces sp. NPDC007856]